jgi:phosphoribosylanthranilate isomerase
VPRVRIKICCIRSLDEARLAIARGADALGLVGAMPSGPGPIDDATIAEIVRTVPPPVATFLLTSETEAEAIIDHARRTRTTALQLVDRVDPKAYAALRVALPGVKLVQVVHVVGPESVEEAGMVAPHVDALLLDSGRPDLLVKELGGTGRAHDWDLSRRIIDAVRCPVFLAGGLKPDNVALAVRTVRPFGVDLCTGVRTDDRLDAAKLDAFVAAVGGVADQPG